MNVEAFRRGTAIGGLFLMILGMAVVVWNYQFSDYTSPENLCLKNKDDCLATNLSILKSFEPGKVEKFNFWREKEKRVQDNGFIGFGVTILGSLLVVNNPKKRKEKPTSLVSRVLKSGVFAKFYSIWSKETSHTNTDANDG